MLNNVAFKPTKRTASYVVSIIRIVRVITASSTGPQSSCNKCSSSRIIKCTNCVYVRSPPLRVTISHFSGVHTINYVSLICSRDN